VSVDLPSAYVTEHLNLGYAMTAHRAQGRTVDVAHAYVTATTTCEPLYVMATRGREANLLYVDTTYDPDRATAHDDLPETDPVAVLRGVLANTGADTSATQTRANEAAAENSPTRVGAEDSAVRALARERRYITALVAAGYTHEDIEAAKARDIWRPLVAKFAAAEKAGLEPTTAAVMDGSGREDRSLKDLGEALADLVDGNRRQRPTVKVCEEQRQTPLPSDTWTGCLSVRPSASEGEASVRRNDAHPSPHAVDSATLIERGGHDRSLLPRRTGPSRLGSSPDTSDWGTRSTSGHGWCGPT